jgi:voltage-gated potassium channel
MTQPSEEIRRNLHYELFILALSIFSFSNIILLLLPISILQKEIVLIVDGITCVFFLSDFAYRYYKAPNKRRYMAREGGWLDFVGSLPFPLLRLARIIRVFRVSRQISGYNVRTIWRAIASERAASSLFMIVLLSIVVVQYASMAVLFVEEKSSSANIKTASDALWWAYVTVATVGYGDRYPVTNLGRWVGFILITVGVGLFTVVTGFLANSFVMRRQRPPTPPPETVDQGNELAEIKRLLYELQDQVAALSAQPPDHSEIEQERK